MDIRKLQRIIVDALVEIKGKDIVVFNTEKLTDQFSRAVFASGTSNRHTVALAENVKEKVKAAGGSVIGFEGKESGEWVLVDCGDAIVHVMQPQIREYYNLEEVWGAKRVNMKIDPEYALPVRKTEKALRGIPVKITIVAVDLRSPAWASTAVEDYLTRFPRDWKVELKTVKEEPRHGQSKSDLMAAEADRIRKAIPKGSLLVTLDERGKDLTTVEFAKKLSAWQDSGESVAFVIGGTDGIDPALKQESRMMIRLSSMTLPHALARVILSEQIYRAWSILNNHPYHRA